MLIRSDFTTVDPDYFAIARIESDHIMFSGSIHDVKVTLTEHEMRRVVTDLCNTWVYWTDRAGHNFAVNPSRLRVDNERSYEDDTRVTFDYRDGTGRVTEIPNAVVREVIRRRDISADHEYVATHIEHGYRGK